MMRLKSKHTSKEVLSVLSSSERLKSASGTRRLSRRKALYAFVHKILLNSPSTSVCSTELVVDAICGE